MSGPIFAEWAASERVVEFSKTLAKHLDCDIIDSVKMKQCLKKKSIDQIMDAVEETGKSRLATNILKYGPRIDGDFFPKQTEELIKWAPPKPTILGTADKEGLFFGSKLIIPHVQSPILGESDSIHQLYIRPESFDHYGENDLVSFICDILAPKSLFGEQSKEIQEKLIVHYINATSSSKKDYKFYLERYTKLISDVLFHVPLAREVHMKMKLGWPLWLYVTDHYNSALYRRDLPVKGATHVGEFPYMFGIFPYGEFRFDEEETKMQSVILNALKNFVKYGNPSSKTQQWKPIAAKHPLRNLRLRPNAVMEENFFDETIKFWQSMDKYDFDIIRGIVRNRTISREEL